MDDISGNSFVENPLAPQNDPHLKSTTYVRTNEQDLTLGLNTGKETGLFVRILLHSHHLLLLPSILFNCHTLLI